MTIKTADTQITQNKFFSLARFADRWIWVFMAVLFILLVLSGFIPDSIHRIQAIQAGQSQPFPWFLHIHAVAMGLWLLLLLAQTLLASSGRQRLHRSLGIGSLALAPVMLIMMVVLAGRIYREISNAPAEVPLAELSGGYIFVFFIQGKSIVLFTLFYAWAIRSRLRHPDWHKRMMILATWSIIDAGIARIPGQDELATALGMKVIGLTSGDVIHVWMLATLLPAMLYDLIRHRHLHYAWVLGIALLLPFAVTTHYLDPASQWWLQLIAAITGRHL